MRSEKPILSVIVPAYNAERTLARTINSIQSQTLQCLEIWIVDDGSKDKTSEIADELAHQDARIHVIHQENGGCYRARLAALRRIKTKWFGFVDADDTILPAMYERMISMAEENNLDVVQIDPVGEKGGLFECYGNRESVMNNFVRPRLVEGKGAALVWNKLYRNQYDFNQFLDINLISFEDYMFNLQLFIPVNRMGWLHEPLYNYVINASCSTKNFNWRNVEGLERILKVRAKYLFKNGVSYELQNSSPWAACNFLNLIWLAATAGSSSWTRSISDVRRLVGLPEVARSVHGEWNRAVLAVMMARVLPSWLIVCLCRLVGWAHRRLKIF